VIPALLILLACAPGGIASNAVREDGPSEFDTLPEAVLHAMRGVVGIKVREVTTVPIFRAGRFREEEIAGLGAGSGVVVSPSGLVMTNAHVVSGSSGVRVRLSSGREVEARILSLDPASDLALLRVDEEGLPPLTMAFGGEPSPGSPAFVIGNQDDRGMEVGWARIGAHRRVRVGARPLEFWSEVNAYVGPGNSGGAVVDSEGRLIGIPSLQILYHERRHATSQSAGLYIPVAHVRRSLSRMLGGPRVVWPWIGLVLDDPLMAASEGRTWREGRGVRVRSVVSDGPSEEAGFRRGDRIMSIDGRTVADNFAALDALLDLEPDRTVTVEVARDGAILALSVIVGVRPPDPRPDALDDFTLHTGLRLRASRRTDDGATLTFAGMSPRARGAMPGFEAELFAQGPTLGSILPGQDALAGRAGRIAVGSIDDLAVLVRRCFVKEQFVAMAHWTDRGGGSLDRAHVHRKIYPVIL
jgi:serine protease DegQ